MLQEDQRLEVTDVILQKGPLPQQPNVKPDDEIVNELWACYIYKLDDGYETFVRNREGDAFYIKNGTLGILDFEGDTVSETQFAFFSFLGIPTLLYHRGLFQLHASAVEQDGKAYLFLGNSGTGKSTLTHSLIDKSTRFIADDVCLMGYIDGILHVYPGIPYIKVSVDMYQNAGYSERYLDLTSENKYLCKILDEYYQPKPVPIAHLFEIVQPPQRKATIQSIKGMDKFSLLRQNPARPRSIACYGLEKKYLQQCLKCCDQVVISRIHRPQEGLLSDSIRKYRSFEQLLTNPKIKEATHPITF